METLASYSGTIGDFKKIIEDATMRFYEMKEIDASEDSEHKDATDTDRTVWAWDEAVNNF